MTFWILAILMTAAVTALVVLALFRAGAVREAGAADVQVYKDQLAEVERDVARGVLTEAEAETVRIEVSRRLLAADRAAASDGRSSSGPGRIAAAGLAVVIFGIAFALYRHLGAPGYPDLPLADRIEAAREALANRRSQAELEAAAASARRAEVQASAEYLALMDQLREALAERPDDIQGHLLLARNEAALGRFDAARAAQERALELMGDAATAAAWADYADILVMAAGGFVSPEAEVALTEALQRDRTNGTARYYSGLLMIQTGRPDLGFRLWDGLLGDSAESDPWVPAILPRIRELAEVAGVMDYTPPEIGARSGPSADDMAAAADLSPEERQEMIQGMVEGLSERLATQGGPVEDWARLIVALGVLGEVDRARAIADEAEAVFAGNTEAEAQIGAARARVGLE